MTEEERKDYLKYIENYTINDLADIFNTQNFVIQDKDKFNEILLYYHFKQNEEMEQLQQENQELKKQLEEYKLITIDYQELEARNKELMKQLEEYKRLGFEHLNDKCNKLENHQKEFIEYLTSYIELLSDLSDYIEEGQKDILEEILSKYKEIIGGKYERNIDK